MATRPTRIRGRVGRRAHLYITEWFEARGLNDEKVGLRLDPPRDRATVWRWRTEQHRLNPDKIAELAHALDLEPQELWRPPPKIDAPESLDAIVSGADEETRKMAADIVRRMVSRPS